MNETSSDESDVNQFDIPEESFTCAENGEQYDVPDNEFGKLSYKSYSLQLGKFLFNFRISFAATYVFLIYDLQ